MRGLGTVRLGPTFEEVEGAGAWWEGRKLRGEEKRTRAESRVFPEKRLELIYQTARGRKYLLIRWKRHCGYSVPSVVS